MEAPSTFTEALNIAMDIDDYEEVSDDAWEYGREKLIRMGADGELLDAIDGYLDFEQFGRDSMELDGVRQTSFGPICRLSDPFPEPEAGQVML